MSPSEPPRDETLRCRPAPTSSSNIHDHPDPAQTPPPVGALPRTALLPQVPGYRVLEEVGRGGMGVVYKAVHEGLKRTVALKMLPPESPTDAVEVARFYAEAEVVAAIQHPNVVQVFEFSQADGRPYMAMEFLPGGSLASRLTAPTTVEDAAALVELLARAVQAAHEQGVVHRDLKPGNVLFDAEGQPHVTDFGLAKRGASNLTRTQVVMGTPAYMAPEQASGRTKYAGPAADIYALGVILYECLIGEPPCGRDGESWEVLHRVLHAPVVAPKSRRGDVPSDLNQICLKCLEKDPTFRYTTSAALADDLLRFLRHEPVSVRPPGRIERAARWAKRRPAAAAAYALGAAVFALVVVGSIVTSLWWKAVESQRTTESANSALLDEQAKTERAKHEAERARDQLAGALANETRAREQLDAAQKQLVATKYFHDVSLAAREYADRNAARAESLLAQCPPERRGWEWWHVHRALHPEIAKFRVLDGYAIGFEDDGRRLVVVDNNFEAPAYDATTGVRLPSKSPFPDFFNKGSSGFALSSDGQRLLETSPNPDLPFEELQISEKKRGTARLWDMATARQLGRWDEFDGFLFSSAISRDGTTAVVAGGGNDGRARGLDLKAGRKLAELPLRALGSRPSLSVDGGRALTECVDADNFIQFALWNPKTGDVLRTARPRSASPEHGGVDGLLAPDGQTAVFVTGAGDVAFWTVDRDEPLRYHPGVHSGQFFKMAFSPDSSLCATAGEGGGVRLWRTKTQDVVAEFQGNRQGIAHLVFHPSGDRLYAIDKTGEATVWRAATGTAVRTVANPFPNPATLALDDKLAAMAVPHFENGRYGLARFDLATMRRTVLREIGDEFFPDVRFQPGGQLVAAATSAGAVELRDAATGRLLRTLAVPGLVHNSLMFTRDGRRLLTVRLSHGAVSEADVWNVETGASIARIPSPTPPGPFNAVISGDGARVAFGHFKLVRVYEVASGREIARFPADPARYIHIRPMALNHDGTLLAQGMGSWQVKLAKVPSPGPTPVTVEPYAVLAAHAAAITNVAFTPDADRLATGCEHGLVKVWDVRTGLEALALKLPQAEPVHRLEFSADGHKLVAVGYRSGATIFDGAPKR